MGEARGKDKVYPYGCGPPAAEIQEQVVPFEGAPESLAQGQTHATDLSPCQSVCPVPSANPKQCKPSENLSYIF